MNEPRYREKVPLHIQEDYAAKLKSLEQEFASLQLASEHIQEQTAIN